MVIKLALQHHHRPSLSRVRVEADGPGGHRWPQLMYAILLWTEASTEKQVSRVQRSSSYQQGIC